jgi:MOSC domain-containing protein YiiM
MGTIESIHVAPEGGAAMQPLEQVQALAGRGLEGDRYLANSGTFSDQEGVRRQVTLIEAEVLEAVQRDCEFVLAPNDTRRNLVTRDVPLTHLVGKTFRIGEAVLRGVKINEPCQYFENLVEMPGVKDALLHRSGLNAEVLSDGAIRVGDGVEVVEES